MPLRLKHKEYVYQDPVSGRSIRIWKNYTGNYIVIEDGISISARNTNYSHLYPTLEDAREAAEKYIEE